jgi:hypothetical protein
MKVTAKLELTVVYDDGGDDNFDPDATLRYLVKYAADNGLLTPDDRPVTVDSYEAAVSTTEATDPHRLVPGRPHEEEQA